MKKTTVVILISLIYQMSFAGRLSACENKTLVKAGILADLLNSAGKMDGINLNFIVDASSIRQINQNQYAAKLTSDHGGPQSYHGRELVITGVNSMLGCKISHVKVIELILASPGVTVWGRTLYRSE